MDWGFPPRKQMPNELRAIMQSLRLSGPATPPVEVSPIKKASSKQIGTRPKSAASAQYMVAPRMTPPLLFGGVEAERPCSNKCGQNPHVRRG